jgi:hypothetical protein
MTTVRQKIQAIEEQKSRQSDIRVNDSYARESKLYFDAQQARDFPSANQLYAPTTYESLSIPNPESETPERIESVFVHNWAALAGGDTPFAKRLLDRLKKADYDDVSISFLNASFRDVKNKMQSQFEGGVTNEQAVFQFLKKYTSTFDSNHDGVRDPNATALFDGYDSTGETPIKASASAGVAIGTPLEDDKPHLFDTIQNAVTQNPSLEKKVVDYAIENRIVGKQSKYVRVLNGKNVKSSDLKQIIAFVNKESVSGNGFKPKVKRPSFAGRGISSHISPKMYVDINHLNKGNLCLKYKSTKKIIGRPYAISDAQKDAVMAILKGDFSKKQYDDLRSGEKEIIHDFIVASKAQGVTYVTQTDELLTKFHILIGEIEAGHNGEEVKQMLRQATNQLMRKKGISRSAGLNILEQIS